MFLVLFPQGYLAPAAHVATANVTQIRAQQIQRQAMSPELTRRILQLILRALHAQRGE